MPSRFNVRESISRLAEEYRCTAQQFEEALPLGRSTTLPLAA
jgi:hypothetical protein